MRSLTLRGSSLASLDHESRLGIFNYFYEMGERFHPGPVPFSGMMEHIAKTGEMVVINANMVEESEPYGLHIPAGVAPKSGVWMPIKSGGRTQGIVSLQNLDREHAFSDSDIRLLQTLANAMSVSLENARLFDETQRLLKETEQRNAELAIINSVQEGLARKLDFRGIVDLVGEKLGEIFKADTIDMGMYDAERDWASNPYYVDRSQRVPLPDGPMPRPSLAVRMVDSRQPLLIGTREEGLRLGSLQIPSEGADIDKNESYLGVPILTANKAIGWMAVQSYEQNAYDQDDLRLLQTLANSMSIALENARLFDETQRLLKETEQRNAELAIINSVQQGLASKLEIRAIYELIGEKVRQIFNADTTYINTYDGEQQAVYSQYYVDNGQRIVRTDPLPPGEGLYARVIQTRQSIVAGTRQEQLELGAKPESSPESEQDLNQSYLGVPILLNDQVKGVVSVQSYRQNAFSENDLRLLQTLANSMSVALENARLFDETQRLLKETEQRAAELAIINSVQDGLVSRLDFQGIIDLVGDKIREIFDAHAVNIAEYDAQADLFSSLYTMERGVRRPFDPMTPGPLFRHILNTA